MGWRFAKMAAAAGRLRGWVLRSSRPLPSHIRSGPRLLGGTVLGTGTENIATTPAPCQHHCTLPDAHAPPQITEAAASEAAERGLRILRERSESLEQDDAVEALRLLLRAASAETVPRHVYYALGELHYHWGELLEFGKRAELGAEGAARAVVAEIKELRKQAMRRRQLAPASSFSSTERRAGKGSAGAATRTRGGGGGKGKDRELFNGGGGGGGGGGGCWGGGGGGHEGQDASSAAKVDHPEAWEWYQKAAACGDTRAMMQLGEIAMESAAKTAGNARHAEDWYREAAGGDPPQPDGLFQIARMRHEGIGVARDPKRARQLYDEACEAGSAAAAYFLGHRFHVGDEELGIEEDGAQALRLLRHASEQGHAEATFYLAQAYRSGSPEMGLPQDLRAFGELIQRAAADGSSDALFALGGAFFHGEDGFARDPRAAFRCYASAADGPGGHADASYCLGVMHYAMGDLQEAFRRYQTAAEGGNMLAWRNLASMYALGEGVAQSERMAKSILQTFGERIERQEREERGEASESKEEEGGEEEEEEEEEEEKKK